MYGALWRLMPGPVWLRVILMIIFFALVLTLLVVFVFPWLNNFVNVNDVTVNQ
ncbi:MAG: rane protein [Microbacteriaceae bacterium]|nr:rane protein [Microbacteriaceae bacterium]